MWFKNASETCPHQKRVHEFPQKSAVVEFQNSDNERNEISIGIREPTQTDIEEEKPVAVFKIKIEDAEV